MVHALPFLVLLLVAGIAAYHRWTLLNWAIVSAIALAVVSFGTEAHWVASTIAWVLFLALAIPLNHLPTRRQFMTAPVLKAYQKMLPSLSETEQVALELEGPLNSGMVEDFVRGRHGTRKSVYQHPMLEPILRDTFGVILYQEQVMQIASVMGGFTLGQADLLRRAMGKKKHDVLAAQRERFLAGASERGVSLAVANEVFSLMEKY